MARLIVKNIGPIKDVDIELKKVNVFIRPEDVAVWEIENGCMKTYTDDATNSTIQDKDGLIRKNFFNHVMGKVMSDFNNLLMYKD